MIKININNLLLRNHKAHSFHILYVTMYSGPLYKSCQPCPLDPTVHVKGHETTYLRHVLGVAKERLDCTTTDGN